MNILIYSENISKHKLHVWEALADSALTDFLPMQTNVSSTSLPVNTLDICCHLKASPWPHTKFKSSKIGHSTKSQGYSILPRLCQLYCHFIYGYSETTVLLIILPARVPPGIYLMSAILPLKHLKRLHHSSGPYPLDPGHSNYSWDWCLWLCTCCCPFNYYSRWQLHPNWIPLLDFFCPEINYDVHDKELLAIFEAFQMMVTLHQRLWTSDQCGTNHWNLQYFSMTKILMHWQAHWSKYVSGFNLIICFHPGKLGTKPDTLTRWWMSILKRGIETMPVSITELPPVFTSKTTGIVPLSYYPINPSPPWISHHGCWKGPIPTSGLNSKRSHFLRTPQQSVRPQVDPQSWWFTMPLQMHLCSKLWQSPTTCSPVLAQPSPCRSFWSDKDPPSSLYAILLVRTSSLHQGLLQIVHHLFPAPNLCATNPRDFSSNFQFLRSLEFHIHGFHREGSLHLPVTPQS